jgi:transmembrane sensor
MEYTEQEEIVRRIIQYLSGESSETETQFLLSWVSESASNKTYYQQVKNIWEITVNSSSLSDISTEKALDKVLTKLSSKKSKKGFVFYWQRVAAVLLVPVMIGSYLWIRSLSGGITSSVIYNEVYAPFGTHSSIKLADGSKVWLNSGSSLRYPDKFVKRQRTVFLNGEAYFEVKSDKSKPFIVQTSNIAVKATGTKFNVSAYKTEKQISVTLMEGKVTVSNNKLGPNALLSELKPNQHIDFDTLTEKISMTESTDMYKFIAWKDGKLVFRNEPMSQVIKKIGQYYNVDIELIGKELQEYRYRATFQEESLDEILKLLKISSPINYKEVNREPLPDRTFPRRKIVIYPNSGI